MRKRYRITNKFRFTVFLALLVLVFASLILLNVQADDGEIYSRTIIVKNGDTLWSIAQENHDYNKHDIRDYIYQVRKLNDLEEASIYPKQELILPY